MVLRKWRHQTVQLVEGISQRLQPKVVIAENVKGLLLGNAINYVRRIYEAFDKAGYECQHFLLDASKMGVPQRRERVFFVCLRKDLAGQFMERVDMFIDRPRLRMEFIEEEIPFGSVEQNSAERKKVSGAYMIHWENASEMGRSYETRNGDKFGFFYKAVRKLPLATITSGGAYSIEETPELLTDEEYILCGSFPLDYKPMGSGIQYMVGMSVPPVMTANVATEVYNQWLSKSK